MPFQFLSKTNELMESLFLKVSWVLVLLMTIIILIQVFFRYVLNNALPWPEEAARGLMIWMTGIVAAPAYRKGNFAAIDLLSERVPPSISKIIRFFILACSLVVLLILVHQSYNFFQRGFRTRSASFDLKLAWIYLAMPVCFITMLMVNLEFIVRLFQKQSSPKS